MNKFVYCNNADIFLYISNSLSDKLVEFQQTEPCITSKEDLEYCVITGLGIKYKIY